MSPISTHSPRVGRTVFDFLGITSQAHFNSLAPCGANPFWRKYCIFAIHISTHSPRVGRTEEQIVSMYDGIDFNSLAPCGANLNSTLRTSTA